MLGGGFFMKNKVAIVISIICVIVVIFGCANWYKSELEKALENMSSGDNMVGRTSSPAIFPASLVA